MESDVIVGQDGLVVAEVFGVSRIQPENVANREFIITACNSHFAIKAALEPFAALDVQSMINLGKKPEHPVFGMNKTIITLGDVIAARQALALAGSK